MRMDGSYECPRKLPDAAYRRLAPSPCTDGSTRRREIDIQTLPCCVSDGVRLSSADEWYFYSVSGPHPRQLINSQIPEDRGPDSA